MRQVVVLDYGIGNLLSVARAFEQCGAVVQVSNDLAKIATADCLVLPGVGAFADGMSGLREGGLIDSIKEFAARERPFLGICLGMQLMLDESEEFGANTGLGLISGKVVAIPATGLDGNRHKIPHIGWNELVSPDDVSWQGTILERMPEGASFYFVHSYTAVPDRPDNRLADCYYNGRQIAAVIKNGYVYGCQFHPEKSGEAGLSLISAFLEL